MRFGDSTVVFSAIFDSNATLDDVKPTSTEPDEFLLDAPLGKRNGLLVNEESFLDGDLEL